MTDHTYNKLMNFLDNLEQGKINYTLTRIRDEAIMVIVVVPGERWEIEFLVDGSVEVERFSSDGQIYGEEVLTQLVHEHSDRESEALSLSQPIEAVVEIW